MSTLPELYPDFDVVVTRIAVTANVNNQICTGNSQRFALLIGISTPVQTWILPEIMSAANQGIFFNAGLFPFVFNFRDHGVLVGRSWNLWTATPGQNAIIIETLYKPK